MTDTLVPGPPSLEALTGCPSFRRIGPAEPCDGHANGGIAAIVAMRLPSGKDVLLCGNCARKAGFEHTSYAQPENRQKGEDH